MAVWPPVGMGSRLTNLCWRPRCDALPEVRRTSDTCPWPPFVCIRVIRGWRSITANNANPREWGTERSPYAKHARPVCPTSPYPSHTLPFPLRARRGKGRAGVGIGEVEPTSAKTPRVSETLGVYSLLHSCGFVLFVDGGLEPRITPIHANGEQCWRRRCGALRKCVAPRIPAPGGYGKPPYVFGLRHARSPYVQPHLTPPTPSPFLSARGEERGGLGDR